MKIVTCASYHGTGSSAITDLISEYKGVKSLTNYEFRFIHDTDGISDLEYHLVQCHNRHNSGYALKRFEKLSSFFGGTFFDPRYEAFFNGQYLKITKEYINELLEFKIKGYRFYDIYEKGRFFYYLHRIISKLLKKMGFRDDLFINEYQYFSHPTESQFLSLTRKYLHRLFSVAANNAEILLMDQIVPSSNLNRCLRYFEDDIKVVVVDRDPRDVYLLNKYFWKETAVPTDPHLYCLWFKYSHEDGFAEFWDISRIKKVYFEDLIYRYNKSVKEIEEFVGLSNTLHSSQFKGLNPKKSIVNTRLWEKYGDKEEISILENELSSYLYDYDAIDMNEDIPGINVAKTSNF